MGGRSLEHYRFDEKSLSVIEGSCIPYAIFQSFEDHGLAITVSDGFCDLFKVDREEALDQLNNRIFENNHPDDRAIMGNVFYNFATKGGDLDLIFRSKIEGEYRIMHCMGKHIYTHDGTRLSVLWYADAGPYSDNNKALYDQSFETLMSQYASSSASSYDTLTGLPGMNYFFRIAEGTRDRLIQEGRIPALVYFDFNDMKDYNLKYGFSEGDKLIIDLAHLISEVFSNINCCRFGGDHFAVITTQDVVDSRLNEVFQKCTTLNNGNSLTLRAGIYLYSMGDVSVGVACDRAKIACDGLRDIVNSKAAYFSDDMLKAAELRHYIIDNIDKAIREGWIKVYYQPLVRATNGRVCDEEALARWVDPVMGFLSPADFIPVLEESKLIYKLDLCVLDLALKKMKILEENHLHIVPCSINISRIDFEMCDIVNEIMTRVDASGIGRDKITIEITESAISSDMEYIQNKVEILNSLGFKVWMDDYGSGYSSPGVLQNIQFNTIKLDMMFMRQFDNNKKSRVVISELINMALNLGLETVVEGVETAEQVEFLREVGATKLQGFYFCKPIPVDDILYRYHNGSQIGFENPAESDYYTAISCINMYNKVIPTSNDTSDFAEYFSTLPMAVFEVGEKEVNIIRCNRSYQKMLRNEFGIEDFYSKVPIDAYSDGLGSIFMRTMVHCAIMGGQEICDHNTESGKSMHTLFRRIAINPLTNLRAVVVIMLDIHDIETSMDAVSYGSVASALSSDYLYLFYVDLDTEEFVEYIPNAKNEDMVISRRGDDFFAASRRDAKIMLHKDDSDGFIMAFTRELVLYAIEEHGSFTYTYRLMINDESVYVNMKATAIGRDKKHLIIGVNNVDAQMRQKAAMEKIKEERMAYSRISALSGDFIVFYTVDLDTENYREFDAVSDYASIGVKTEGTDFFNSVVRDIPLAIYHEDQELFLKVFTKENILNTIAEKGVFVHNYRLLINGSPRYVSIKIAKTSDNGIDQLLLGVIDIDEQVRREQKYAYDLAAARNKANLDPLTGVKNKNAYKDIATEINKAIKDHKEYDFAVLIATVNNVKEIKSSKGLGAGDIRIHSACMQLCRIFRHSPVFRIDEDVFVAVIRGDDYTNIDKLMEKVSHINSVNQETDKATLSVGMSRFDNDPCIELVFERARYTMLENMKENRL